MPRASDHNPSTRPAQPATVEDRDFVGRLIENLPGMAYRSEREHGSLDFASHGARELTGYPASDLLADRRVRYGDIIHPGDREHVALAVESAIANHSTFQAEYRIQTADGDERWAWEQGRGVYSADGELLAVEGYVTDVTQRRMLSEQLRQSQKLEALGQLAGGVAHDFNNLITVILGYCQMLGGASAANKAAHDGIEQIRKAADRAATLTGQLLTFSRRQVFRPRMLSLNDVISDLDRMLRRIIGEDVKLKTHLDPHLRAVRSDAGHIQQIVMNLVVNARDAMPKGGTLTIETGNVGLDERYAASHTGVETGSYVLLSVTDTGIGMAPAVRRRIFEPFFTTKPGGKGSGLGLATVYGIVKQNNGHLWVYSEPGRGTTFKVYFPLGDKVEAEAEETRLTNETLSGTETVLLVEDEPEVRNLVTRALSDQGYTVLEAGNGVEAIALIEARTDPIDLLVTDVVMPAMGGIDLVRTLDYCKRSLPTLYISGYTDNSTFRRGMLDEQANYLSKPFTLDALLRKVREVLVRG